MVCNPITLNIMMLLLTSYISKYKIECQALLYISWAITVGTEAGLKMLLAYLYVEGCFVLTKCQQQLDQEGEISER